MSLPAGLTFVNSDSVKVSVGAIVSVTGGVAFDAAGAMVTTAVAPSFVNNGNPGTTLGSVSVISKATAVAPLNQQNGMTYDANGRLVTVDIGLATAPFASANGMTFDASGALITSA